MKKALIILVLILIMLQLSVSALTFKTEEYDQQDSTLQSFNEILEINGELYYKPYTGFNCEPVKYNEEAYNFFSNPSAKHNIYVSAGEYYFARGGGDGTPINYRVRYNVSDVIPIGLYDKDFILIKEYKPQHYISDISYVNGVYYYFTQYDSTEATPQNPYAQIRKEECYASTDFENWTLIDGGIPKQSGNIVYKNPKMHTYEVESQDPYISFNTGNDYKFIKYENIGNTKWSRQWGKWIVKADEEYNFYFSNDNIYFVKVSLPENINEVSFGTGSFSQIYEYEEDVRIETNVIRLSIPISELYPTLDEIKNAPRVLLNDKYLGFEVAPVLENDRTLVPMRFLFEQMGETVTWDNNTKTATVSKATNEKISFSINDTTAKINDIPTTMEVPARLIDSKTMVPLRFLSENLGYTVEWDATTNTAIINTENKTTTSKDIEKSNNGNFLSLIFQPINKIFSFSSQS